jgi:hypothetical protein
MQPIHLPVGAPIRTSRYPQSVARSVMVIKGSRAAGAVGVGSAPIVWRLEAVRIVLIFLLLIEVVRSLTTILLSPH